MTFCTVVAPGLYPGKLGKLNMSDSRQSATQKWVGLTSWQYQEVHNARCWTLHCLQLTAPCGGSRAVESLVSQFCVLQKPFKCWTLPFVSGWNSWCVCLRPLLDNIFQLTQFLSAIYSSRWLRVNLRLMSTAWICVIKQVLKYALQIWNYN